jgi:hypothetical protein
MDEDKRILSSMAKVTDVFVAAIANHDVAEMRRFSEYNHQGLIFASAYDTMPLCCKILRGRATTRLLVLSTRIRYWRSPGWTVSDVDQSFDKLTTLCNN